MIENLFAGLARLQCACCTLAGSDESRHLGAVGVEVTYHCGLHPHGILKARDRVLPTDLSIGDECLVREVWGGWRVRGRERAIDLLDIEGDALGLGEQLLRTLDRLLQLMQRRIWKAREIRGLIDQHRRLILQRCDWC